LVVVLESGTGFKPRPLTVFRIRHRVHLTAIRRWVRLRCSNTTPLKFVRSSSTTPRHHDRHCHRQHHQWNELLHLNLLCLTVLNPIGLSCLNTQDILYCVLYTQTYFLSSYFYTTPLRLKSYAWHTTCTAKLIFGNKWRGVL